MEIKRTYNPLTLSHDYRTFENEGLSPNKFLERENIIFTRPVVLLINGIPVLRKSWDIELQQKDVCHFVELPRDDILQILGSIAVMFAAIYFPPLLGLTGAWGALAGAAIMVGGTMLVNMFFGPSMPQPSMRDYQIVDEYNINAGRNTLQIGKPYPEHFGRFICFPCLVMNNYTEYIDNKQYFYMLGIIGIDEYDIENVYIDETPIGDYADTSYNIISPGGIPTLCPNLVWPANGISGQELDIEWLTNIVSVVGTEISEIGFDVVFAGGLCCFNDQGDICTQSVTVRTEARTVDDDGIGITDWTLLHEGIYSKATISPLRYTQKISAPCSAGRYEFRIKRTTAKSTSSKVVDTVNIESLRGYGALHPTYEDVTLIEVKIKATDKLNGAVAQKINLVCTRKLCPVTATGFGIKAASRSIVDACAYIVTSDNGGKQPDSILEFESLADLRAILATRENYFDHRFVSQITAMEACKTITRCGRAVPYMPGGLFSIVRDKLQTVPTQVYTDDDYTENTLNLDHIIRTDDDPTCVEVEYVDPDTWQTEKATYYEYAGSFENPAKLPLIGCTSRQHAWEEAGYMYKDDEKNRTGITFTTGLKGHIPKLGDMVYVASRHVDWGQTGQLVHISTTVATLSEPVDFGEVSEGKLLLTSKTGGVLGPYTVTNSDIAHTLTISLTSDIVNTIHAQGEKATKFLFGPTVEEMLRVRILKILPSSNNEVRIIGSIIHDEVHDEVGDAPALGTNPVALPILDNLTIIYQGVTGTDYGYYATWLSSEDKFRVELDEGSGYAIIADNLVAYGYEFTTTILSISVKVTPYVDGVLTPAEAKIESFDLPPAPINLQASDDGTDVTITWNAVTGADYYEIRMEYDGETVWTETSAINSAVAKIDDISTWIDDIYISVNIYVRTCIGILAGPESSLFSWQYANYTGIFCKSFNDAIVSGSPLIIRLLDQNGVYYYTKVYPTISASIGGTVDDIGESLRGINDATLSGTPKIAKIESGGNEYHIKVYPTISSEVENSVGVTLDIISISDIVVSGTPRVGRVQINSVYHYLKIYPV